MTTLPKILLFLGALYAYQGLRAEEASLTESLRGEDSAELIASEDGESKNIYRHRPIYIISGDPDTKVQFSLKLRLITKWDLFFAYSQQIFWELGKKSSPFRDATYNPELFYRWHAKRGIWESFDFGVEHISNGKDEDESRSLDRAFTQANAVFGWGNTKLNWQTRLYYSANLDETNSDIRKYMGFWNMRLGLVNVFDSWLDKGEVYVMFYPGGTWGNRMELGGREFGLRFRLGLFGEAPYFFFQAYNGYSESLLNYNEFEKSYRAGFQF